MAKAVKTDKIEQIVSTKKLTKVKKAKKGEKDAVKSKPIKDKLAQKALKKKQLKQLASVKQEPADTEEIETEKIEIPPFVLEKAVTALKDGYEAQTGEKSKENLFSSDVRYGLQVVFVKIPQVPNHNRKILLKHSLYDEQPDTMFIIRDKSKKDGKAEERVLEFQQFLKKNGIENVKTVITLKQLKKDYGTHNTKLNLLRSYDIFLVEPEIAEHTYTFLGKHFISKRKRPFQVHTEDVAKMKIAIQNASLKSSFKLGPSSSFSVIEVGTHKMEKEKILENITTTIEQLETSWPGGFKNVLRLYLKPMTPSKVSVPIYCSKIDPNDVEIPVEKGPKQMRRDQIAKKLEKNTKKLRLDPKSKKVVQEKQILTSTNINKQMKEGKVKTVATTNVTKMSKKNSKKNLKKNAN